MAIQRFLALAVLLLAVASVEGRSKYQGRLLKISYKAPPGPTNNQFTVTTEAALITALATAQGGTITLQFGTIVLSRGLTTNFNYAITCASGFTCIFDCSLVTYTACINIHGGATVSITGVTFDGKSVSRTAPLIDVGGSTTTLTLASSTLKNANVVGPSNAAGAGIEVFPPTAGSKTKKGSNVILKSGTVFSNNNVLGSPLDIGVYGSSIATATVTSCFATSSAGTIPGIEYSGITIVSVCATATPSNPPVPVNGSTSPTKTTVTSGTCPYAGC